MNFQTSTLVTAIALSCCLARIGDATAADGDGWQYELTPYFLAAGLNGKAGIRGVTTDVDMSFGDIWNDLDAGLMGLFTARKGRWSYGLEGVYFKLESNESKSVKGPSGTVNVNGAIDLTSSMRIYQGTVGYQLLDGPTQLDLVGALRYTQLDAKAKVEITTTPGIVFPGGSTKGSGNESWTDAVVGLRVQHPVSDHIALLGYADVGGGGSDLTYQLIAGANWAFKDRYTAKVGYRYMSWDYDHNGTRWDMAASGPYLGLGIAF